MATSGSFNTSSITSVASKYPKYFNFSWSRSSYVAGVSTTISWSVTLQGGQTQYQTVAVYSGSVTVNGQSYSWSGGGGQHSNGYVVKSGTTTINHTGAANFYVSCSGYLYGSSGSANNASGGQTFTLDGTAVAPSGLSATLVSVGQDYADISASLASYGTPLSDDRYMEVAVMGSSTYGNPYRYVKSSAQATSMGPTRVDNTALTGATPLTITPNTRYYYGTWATNASANSNVMPGDFITLPASFTSVSCTNEGDLVTVTWSRAAEGTAATVTKEYSIDGGTTWTTFTTNPFSFRTNHSGTIQLRARSSAGSSPVAAASFIAQVSHLYGSVNGESKLLDPVYVSVNGTAKKITKLYVGDQNGVARKVIG